MRQESVTSFTDFVKHTEAFDLLVDLVVFRGQPQQGNLLPAIIRQNPSVNPLQKEQEIFKQLRLLGASILPEKQDSWLDLLVLAQHSGLKTRLLDWTTNPLIALWFACSDQKEGDVYVYALEADSHLEPDPYNSEPLNLVETRVFQPRFNNPRIIAQQGWFSLHRHSVTSECFVSLENNLKTREHLHEFRIPEANRPDILRSLDRHGVNARTIYPDLSGLCQYLNWRHGVA
ncbi:MAG TPA: FRG domain-containing protein [Methylophilaceae bacterium]|jgi:hypothetical protein